MGVGVYMEGVWVRRWRGVNGGWVWGDEKEGEMGSGWGGVRMGGIFSIMYYIGRCASLAVTMGQ